MPKIYGSSEIWGDLLVTGSFSILGSASSINTTSLVVSDTILALGHSQSGTPVLDEGLMFVRGTGATQAFIWDESDDTFALVETNSDHTVVGDISINSYSNLRVGGLTTSSLKIIGGTNGYILTSDSSGNANWTQLPGGLTGSGTTNYVSKWTASGTLGNSIIQDDGTTTGIGTSPILNSRLYITDNRTNTFKYGVFSQVEGNNVSTDNAGLYSVVSGASIRNQGLKTQISGTYGYRQGISIEIGSPSSISNDYGIYTYLDSLISSSNPIYGQYIQNSASASNKYGIYSQTSGNNSQFNFGIYNQVSGATSANYGVYNVVSGTYGSQIGYLADVSTSNNPNDIMGFWSLVSGGSSYNIGSRNQVTGTYGIGYRQAQQNFLGSVTGISADATLVNFVGTNFTGSTLYNVVNYNYGSASTKYNLSNFILSGDSNTNYSISNVIYSTFSSTGYGIFNQLSGSGLKYGLYQNIGNGTYSSTAYGVYNSLTGDGLKYGLVNNFGGTYSPNRFGIYTTSTGNNTNTYGEFIQLSGTGSTNYGIYIDSFSASNNYGIVVNRGDVVFNESGENYDFRVEGMTQSHLLYVDAYRERVYMGTNTSTYLSSIDFVNITSAAVNTKSASYSVGYYSETSGGDVENYGYLSYLGTSKTYNSNTGFYSAIVLSSATETTNYGYYTDISGTGNGSNNVGFYSKLTTVGWSNIGVAVDVSGATSANTGISIDTAGASATAIITSRGSVIFNESGGDYDFRVEGDTDQNLLFADASTDRIGVGTAFPLYKLQVLGTVSTTGFRMTNGASNGFVLSSNSDGVGSWTSSIRDLSFGHSSISPTNSTTYYIGMVPQLQPTTTDQVSRRIRSPYRGEITSVSIMWSLTTNGSSEAVTYQIHNITQATSSTVTSAAQLTGDSHNTYTLGSPLAVSENDDLQIRWVTPVWATKPTSAIHVITARIRVY